MFDTKDSVRMFCECVKNGLHSEVRVVASTALEKVERDWIVISDDCPNGPALTDKLMTWGDGYAIYETKRLPLF